MLMPASKDAVDWASVPVAIEAGLWFRYGRQRRDGVTADSTFEAVLRGERVSTTRFERWPGHARWREVRPGDLVRFFEEEGRGGRSLIVRILSVEPIDLWSCGGGNLPEPAGGGPPPPGPAVGRGASPPAAPPPP